MKAERRGLSLPLLNTGGSAIKYLDFVSQPAFFSFLLEIDRSIAAEAHGKPCHRCNGKLDRADFWRSGHGLPGGADEECRRRFSLCCRVDGCRARLTPESVRFLRGMSYVSFVIVLLSALSHGPSGERLATLAAQLNVSRQTIKRWITWWRNVVILSPLWRVRRGEFMPTLAESNLPQSLLDHYIGMINDSRAAVLTLLRFLAPLRPK